MVTGVPWPGLVLGYSPYLIRPGLLNAAIRLETVMTAMQFMGWAMAGRPYMGVGRNLAFPKEWFLRADPLARGKDVPYGDDDAIVQAASGKIPVFACLSQDAFVDSFPANTWAGWLGQKYRHISAGHQYSGVALMPPVLMAILLTGSWILPWWTPPDMRWTLVMGVVSLVVRWINFARWCKRLENPFGSLVYPVFELLYIAYLVILGLFAILKPKPSWN